MTTENALLVCSARAYALAVSWGYGSAMQQTPTTPDAPKLLLSMRERVPALITVLAFFVCRVSMCC